MLELMENADQQNLAQLTISKHKTKLLFAVGIFLIAFLSGGMGYMWGERTGKNQVDVSQQTLLLPAPTNAFQATPTVIQSTPTIVFTSAGQVPTPFSTPDLTQITPDTSFHPLQSKQDLPLIASAVIDWVVKQQPSPNPEINFEENDGTYANGGLGDLTQKGGEEWYAAKINGIWTVVYVGQSTPRCSDIAQYHLPKGWLPCDSSL